MHSILFGYWVGGWGGRSPKGFVHYLVMLFFTLGSSKIHVFPETYPFDPVTTQNDHSKYVKHVFDGIYVFLALFGCWLRGWAGRGPPKGLIHNLLV